VVVLLLTIITLLFEIGGVPIITFGTFGVIDPLPNPYK
jgi:hypothetical protein